MVEEGRPSERGVKAEGIGVASAQPCCPNRRVPIASHTHGTILPRHVTGIMSVDIANTREHSGLSPGIAGEPAARGVVLGGLAYSVGNRHGNPSSGPTCDGSGRS
jgi:hypothetical protein